MALKIRLRQHGKTNNLTYRLVVTDSRSPRNGKYLEKVGHYDPSISGDEDVTVTSERISFWLDQGAEMSPKVECLIARGAPEVFKAYKQRLEKRRLHLLAKKRKAKK